MDHPVPVLRTRTEFVPLIRGLTIAEDEELRGGRMLRCIRRGEGNRIVLILGDNHAGRPVVAHDRDHAFADFRASGGCHFVVIATDHIPVSPWSSWRSGPTK